LHLPSAHDPNARGRLSLARLSDKFAIIIQAARLRSNMAPAQTSNKLAPKPASQPASAAAPNSPPAVSWRRANLLQAPKTTNKQWAAPRPIGASSPHRRQAPAGGATDAPLVNIGRRPSTATLLSPGLACSPSSSSSSRSLSLPIPIPFPFPFPVALALALALTRALALPLSTRPLKLARPVQTLDWRSLTLEAPISPLSERAPGRPNSAPRRRTSRNSAQTAGTRQPGGLKIQLSAWRADS